MLRVTHGTGQSQQLRNPKPWEGMAFLKKDGTWRVDTRALSKPSNLLQNSPLAWIESSNLSSFWSIRLVLVASIMRGHFRFLWKINGSWFKGFRRPLPQEMIKVMNTVVDTRDHRQVLTYVKTAMKVSYLSDPNCVSTSKRCLQTQSVCISSGPMVF